MEYQRLGSSGLEVSPICLGTMMFGDRTDAPRRRRDHRRTRSRPASTSSTPRTSTRNGASENDRRCGDQGASAALDPRHEGRQPDDAASRTTADCRGAGCCSACDDSLARLATDYIDIYYLHKDDPDTPIAETVGAIGDLITRGKIRYFGVSNYRGWRIAEVVSECEAQGVPLPVVCQPYYNLLNRMPEVEILPACDHYGIGVASVFADRARRADRQVPRRRARPRIRAVARSDRRMLETEFREESFAIAQKLDGARARRPAARRRSSRSRGCGRTEIVTSVIAGPRTLEQWQDYVGALGTPWSDEDEALVDSLVHARASVDARLQRSAVSVLRANRRRLSSSRRSRAG